MDGVKSMPHSVYGAKSTYSSVAVPSESITDQRPLSSDLFESTISSPNRTTAHKTVRGTLHGIKSRSTVATMKSPIGVTIADSDNGHQTATGASRSTYMNDYHLWNSVKSNRIYVESSSSVPRSLYTSGQKSSSDSLSETVVPSADRPNVYKIVRGTINGIKPRMIVAAAKSTVGEMRTALRHETDTETGRRSTDARSFSASDQESSSNSLLGPFVPSSNLLTVHKMVRGTLHGIKSQMIAAASRSTNGAMAKIGKITPADQE